MVNSIKCSPLDIVELKSEIDQLQGVRDSACDLNRQYELALVEQDRVRVEGEVKLAECTRVQQEDIAAAEAAFDAAVADANAMIERCVAEINAANDEAFGALVEAEVKWQVADQLCTAQIAYVHALVDGSSEVVDPTADPV